MPLVLLLAFATLIVIRGSNVALVVANGVAHGARHGAAARVRGGTTGHPVRGFLVSLTNLKTLPFHAASCRNSCRPIWVARRIGLCRLPGHSC